MSQNPTEPVSKRSERTVSLTLRQELSDAIRRGRYRPGDKLPTARELGRQYGISHVVVLAALEPLVERGYVVKRHGSGIFVADSFRASAGVVRIGATGRLPEHMDEALDRFRALNAGIRVEVSSLDEGPADVLVLSPSTLVDFRRRGLTTPLDDLMHGSHLRREDFHPFGLTAAVFGGATHAVPYRVAPAFILCNAALLDRRERQRLPLWSMDDMLDAVRQIHRRHGGKGVKAIAQRRSWLAQVKPFLSSFGGRVMDADGSRAVLDEEGSVRAHLYCRELMRSTPGIALTEKNGLDAFLAGQLAVATSALETYPVVRRRMADAVAAPFPLGAAPTDLVQGIFLAVDARSNHPESAWTLLRYLVGPSEQNALADGHYLFPGLQESMDRMLLAGAGAYDLIARSMLPPPMNPDRPGLRLLLFVDRLMTDWWEADDVRGVLRRTTPIVTAHALPHEPADPDVLFGM